MENVLLVVHLILALCLIGIVLLQRSEGGGLGMGGGGGAMTGRQAATAMTKLTWAFAVAFLCTSVALTIVAASNTSSTSVIDTTPSEDAAPALPGLPTGEGLLPPSQDAAPLAPPRTE